MSKIDRIRSQLSDGLEAAKVREHLSNVAIARAYEMGPAAVSRIIKGDDVKLNLNQALELLLLAGLEIKRGEEGT